MRTVPTRIAIVADCDDTLAPDTTAQLLRRFGVDPDAFYRTNTRRLVDEGYDPPVAYMNEMLRLARRGGPLEGLTRDAIGRAGAEMDFYPGVPAVFETLEEEIEGAYGHLGIRLEEYVVTGGIADLIAASPLARVVDDMWGCNFAYDEAGKIAGIRNVVSFTEKTRFLFNIEKGLVGNTVRGQPYAVNKFLDPDERPVPMRNMIYLGDGPSDVPCMSIIQRAQGWVIGILNRDRPDQAWALGYGRRANVTVPPDFRNGEHGWSQLREAVIKTAERITGEIELSRRTGGPAPRY